jgi:hypothetical protein
MDSKDIMKMSTQDQVSYWLGQLLIAIGSGDLRSAIYHMISFYQQEAYDRGVAATKKK